MNVTVQTIAMDIAGLAFVALSCWALITGRADVWHVALPVASLYLGVKVPTPGSS